MATFDLEVEPLEDADEAVALRFKSISPARGVTRVRGVVGAGWCAVQGLDAGGSTVPAQAILIEDSSEGTAALVFGGVHGLVLHDPPRADTREPYLVLAPDAVE